MKKEKLNIFTVFSFFTLMLFFLMPLHGENFKDKNTSNLFKKYNIGYYFQPGLSVWKNHRISGYGVDYTEKIAEINNWKTNNLIFSRNKISEEIGKNNIDILVGISKEESEALNFDISDFPIGREYDVLYVKKNSPLNYPGDMEGRKIGILTSKNTYKLQEELKEKVGINYIPVFFDNNEDLIHSLMKNKIDGVLSTIFLKENNTKIIKILDFRDIYFGISQDKDFIKSSINNAVENLYRENPDFSRTLLNKRIFTLKNFGLLSGLGIVLLVFAGIFIFITWKPLITKIEKFAAKKYIQQGMKENRFMIYYQPIVDTNNNEITKLESLIRLRDKKKGILSPAEIFPIVEKSGLMQELGVWVFKKVVEEFDGIKDALPTVRTVSVNFTYSQIKKKGLLEEIKAVLKQGECSPENLCIEITEKEFVDDEEFINKKINEFKELGCSIAIDDFGQEYSTLSLLNRICFDYLKIDKAFIDKIVFENESENMVAIIMEIAILKGKKVIAEGVENYPQVEKLKMLGCNFLQGYFFAKPMPLKLLGDFYKDFVVKRFSGVYGS